MLHVNCSVEQQLPSPLLSLSHHLYISRSESHTHRYGVGVKGSAEMGLAASPPLLYRVDRLLLQQHQWWKIDDTVVLLLLKLTYEATERQLSHNVFYWWETPPSCAVELQPHKVE